MTLWWSFSLKRCWPGILVVSEQKRLQLLQIHNPLARGDPTDTCVSWGDQTGGRLGKWWSLLNIYTLSWIFPLFYLALYYWNNVKCYLRQWFITHLSIFIIWWRLMPTETTWSDSFPGKNLLRNNDQVIKIKNPLQKKKNNTKEERNWWKKVKNIQVINGETRKNNRID